MTTDYVKQIEEENFSLKNLLDERTKDLDEAKKEIESWKDGLKYNRVSPEVTIKEFDISTIVNHDAFVLKSDVCIGGERITAQDIQNFKHLWTLHMQKVNNPPLLYRIWRKIVSCLTTKKN